VRPVDARTRLQRRHGRPAIRGAAAGFVAALSERAFVSVTVALEFVGARVTPSGASPRAKWLLAVALCASVDASLLAQGSPSGPGELDVVRVRENVYMLAGAGGNVAVHIGPTGVILVDTGAVGQSDKILTAVKRLSDRPIRYIINTSADAEHSGGNDVLSKAGKTILGFQGSSGISAEIFTNGGAASVLAHENVLAKMSRAQPSIPFALWPTKTYSGSSYPMYLNGEGIQVLALPAARSDGDSAVVFRRADVIVTGDVFDTTRFPVIDVASGGSIQGEIDAVNRLLDLTIPPFPLRWQEDRTLVVPGHGFVADYADLAEYRNVVTIVRDRIKDMVDRGMTLAQVEAANPTQGFARRYGAESGNWTTQMFVEAVYTSLTTKR
jgi:cyclase